MNTTSTTSTTTKEWPYVVNLLKLGQLFSDNSYQRPPQEKFVEQLISEFDETLVGVLDVSDRGDGTYAILDGRQRYEALVKFKKTVWCAVYEGMTRAEEAMYFYLKNRNRRSVHPYYQFRALMVTGHKPSININRIVESEGYKLGIGASQDDTISAIRAVEFVYDLSSLQRKECLSPTMHILRKCFYGRQAGKEGVLIRGLGKFFQAFADNDIDFQWLEDKLAGQNPLVMLGRAEDKSAVSRESAAFHLARDIAEIYNRGRKAGHRLGLRFIEGKG